MPMFDGYPSIPAHRPVLGDRWGARRKPRRDNDVLPRGQLMHARMNMLAGDPAQLSEATRYLEGTVRPHVEGQPGSRGLAFLVNADLGTCVVASYWDSLDAMTASEQAVQVSRKEIAERLQASVTVEHYEVPVFVRRARPAAE